MNDPLPLSHAAALKTWLIEQGLKGTDRTDMLREFCERLVNAGIPLLRMQLGQRAFHPEFGGIGFTWTRADGLRHEYFENPERTSDEWRDSPFYHLIDSAKVDMAEDLIAPKNRDYPIFAELRAMGGTGYFANWQPVGPMSREECDPENFNSEGVVASWTCDGEGGMRAEYQDLIRACFETLVVVLSTSGNRQMGRDLLKVYLGRDAGERVLSGEIRRGSTQDIDAVVFLFDLNGFTALSERLPGSEVVEMLNSYLDHVIEVVQGHGGNILKFLGDGVLAMFNLGTLEADARAALDAAAALQARLSQVNAQRADDGLPHAGYRVTLHAGEILYGNIGAENRLDFTVIGPTVNLTARMSDLHRAVDREVLLSEEVRRAAGTVSHDLVSVGRYMLRGVAAPMEMFTIYLAKEGPEGGSATPLPASV